MMIDLRLGDCLDIMRGMEADSVDAIITDLPYGTTACKWDVVIPFEPMWSQIKRILKPRGAFVTTASQPFTTLLIASNLEWFKYCWVWEKEQGSIMLNAPYQPIKVHEDITVFSKYASTYSRKGSMCYYPQMKIGKPYKSPPRKGGKMQFHASPNLKDYKYNNGTRYPKTVLRFNTERGKHPTQKPIALYEYLIRTYTNEGDTVLDFCMGSGTTGVACVQLNRNFIGCEIYPQYFEIAKRRIEAAQPVAVELPLMAEA